MPPKPVVMQLKLPNLPETSSQLCKWDIDKLNRDQSLIMIATFGGPPSEETLAENARRSTEYKRRYIEIIKKHGVEEEYLTPLIEKRNRLWTELTEVCQDIELIRG
ncbi:MAG: hypothetical protein RLZZ480_27 [Candidatus Parcubacteria bacterium]|jgi:hypothetical protein